MPTHQEVSQLSRLNVIFMAPSESSEIVMDWNVLLMDSNTRNIKSRSTRIE